MKISMEDFDTTAITKTYNDAMIMLADAVPAFKALYYKTSPVLSVGITVDLDRETNVAHQDVKITVNFPFVPNLEYTDDLFNQRLMTEFYIKELLERLNVANSQLDK